MKNHIISVVFVLFILMQFAGILTANAQDNKAFLNPPATITNPDGLPEYSMKNRKFNGVSSIAVSPNGRIWATYYSGKTAGEDENNYVVLATSGNGGKSFEEVLIIDPDGEGPVRAYDPQIWLDPTGKLWLFWAQGVKKKGGPMGVWAMTTTEVENMKARWSEPNRICDGIMMSKPTVLSNGEWLLPVSTWFIENSAKVVSSTDMGKTWNLKGACNVPKDQRNADEHMIVEKKDGSLWMLVRVKYGIGESFSRDGGKTWSELTPSSITHTMSRFFISRLKSGNLLLVKNGPMNMRIPRSHVMAFISKDDGATWSRGLLLDERRGAAYPDGQQTADGVIHITHDYNRMSALEVLYTTFTEEDVMDEAYDEAIYRAWKNRKIVSKGEEN